MLNLYDYDTYIFDCDGVILDSNKLKIQAMKEALEVLKVNLQEVQLCIDYFSKNFGTSRYHHVQHFVENILQIHIKDQELFSSKLLALYSEKVRSLYAIADMTPGFIEFITKYDGHKFVASGSDQSELRNVFEQRGLSKYFNGVYGSPTKKIDIISNILISVNSKMAIMFGDARSDYEASKSNSIDFVAYKPYSNVPDYLTELSVKSGILLLNNWSDI